MNKEFVVTGHLQQKDDDQTLILHRSFMTVSRESAIDNFHKHFEPDLKVIKIFSVVDQYGNVV